MYPSFDLTGYLLSIPFTLHIFKPRSKNENRYHFFLRVLR